MPEAVDRSRNGHVLSPHRDEAAFLRLVSTVPESEASLRRVVELLERKLDWATVLELGARHRLLPILAHVLDHLPESQLQRVPLAARRCLMHCAIQGKASSAGMWDVITALLEAFDRQDIPAMIVKGLSAGALYPAPALRPSDDIDLLVREDDWPRLARVLADLRFAAKCELSRVARLSPAQVVQLAAYVTQVKYVAPGGTTVEVHFRMFNIGIPAPREDAWDRRRLQPIGEETLPTLGREDTILYHAMHANMHRFSRLIWLTDLRLMLHGWAGHLDWSWIAQRARTIGIENSLGYSIELAQNLGPTIPDVPEPSSLMAKSRFRRDRFRRRWDRRNISALKREAPRFTGVHYYLQDVASWPNRARYLKHILFPPRWCLDSESRWQYLRRRMREAGAASPSR